MEILCELMDTDTENKLVVTSGEKIGAEAIREHRIKMNKLLGIK